MAFGMVKTDSRWSEQDASSWWFRALDQRVIQVGLHEWRLHVTGIYVHVDEIWIQLADGGRYDGIAPLGNSEWIAAHVPGAALRVYEGGHIFFLQDSRALPEIGAFLAA